MHCSKHPHGHCSGRGSKHKTQPHIVIPPIIPPSHLLSSPEIINESGLFSLSPQVGPSIGGNLISINGFNLIFTTSVTMGEITVPFTIISNNQIQIIALPQALTQNIQITVRFKNGSSESLPYAYINAPNITSLTPSAGPITGNNIVTIAGTGLAATTSIYFNTIVTYNFVIISDSIIHVAVPNLTGQTTVLVRLHAPNISSNDLPYTLIPPPVI